MAKKTFNILILAGGESTEREVSLTSAKAVADAFTLSGHRLCVIDSKDGRLLTDESGKFLPEKSMTADVAIAGSSSFALELARHRREGVDVVFNALHGGAGENGRIQALLDILGLPYTGSPMAASATAMNKDISKRVMQSLDIPTAEWLCFERSALLTPGKIAAEAEDRLSLPVVVKPTDGGSTVGLTLVEEAGQFVGAIKAAFAVADSIIIEKYLKGREITIALLDGQPLPPVEIKPSHKLYDYTCKYTKGKSQYICPADLELTVAERLSRDAMAFYKTIGCRGYARVDFIVGSGGRSICLELNTLPGMTSLSLFPMAAKAVGIGFEQLLEKLCELALENK